MTDKQIINRVNVKECEYYCDGKCERYEEFVEADYANYSVKCICEEENVLGTYDVCDYQQLKRKEQECEKLKEEIKRNGFGCFNIEMAEQLDQLKSLIEKYEECNKYLVEENGKTYTRLEYKLLRTINEIKPILDFYANSSMGEEQSDKTYHIRLNGGYIMVYDPKPAKQALQKISEVEND